jgi:NADH dehydrogenase [ubiquinone] 1 alpha subcomplex assembly factor 5
MPYTSLEFVFVLACSNCRKFDVALDLGCGRGHIARHVLQDVVGVLHQSDMAEHVLVFSDL